MKQPIPITSNLRRPNPICITLAASTNESSYSLVGPSRIAHRSAQPSSNLGEDGLLSALCKALEAISENRKKELERKHFSYEKAVFDAGGPPPSEAYELQVEIRTDSAALVSAGPLLRELTEGLASTGLLRELSDQLKRFSGLRWVQLPNDAAEVEALRRWASTHCKPGRAFMAQDLDRSWRRSEAAELFEDREEFRPNVEDEEVEYQVAA